MKFKAPEGEEVRVTDMYGNVAIVTEEERELPEKLHRAALAAGAIPVYDKGEKPVSTKAPKLPEGNGQTREDAIFEATKKVLEENDPDNFTQGGSPTTEALSKATGFNVTAQERNEAWTRLQALMAMDDGDDEQAE